MPLLQPCNRAEKMNDRSGIAAIAPARSSSVGATSYCRCCRPKLSKPAWSIAVPFWPAKDALVHEAMALYRAEVLGPLVDRLARGGRAGLEAFWDAVAKGVKTPGWSGCFLFRSAGGALHADPIVARHFDEHVGLLRAGVTRALRGAQTERAIDTSIDVTEAGWQVVAFAALISTYGALSGNSRTVTALISAGRAACGLGRHT